HAARQALIEAEERFRATFEQAAVGIAHLSPDRRILRVNETLCSVLGYDRDELVGTVAAELIHPDDRARSAAEVEALLRRDSPSRSWELRYRKKSGGYLWAEVTISAARLDGGSSYLIAVAQDVTERKRIEEERERLARQVRLLLASTGAGLFTVDLDGRCTLINRAACESLGYSEKEIVGRPIREVLYGGRAKVPAEATSAIESANAGEATKLYNQRFNRRDGSTLPVDLTVSPIVEDGIVIGRAVSFVDVSDRMRLEQQLEEAKRLSSLGRLAASIAHEINNVLMGILPFAEIVTRSKEQTFRNAGEQIRQSVQRGRGVTQEILRFARDEAPHRHVFEGRTWFRSIAGELQEIAGRQAWSLKLPDQPFHLNADPSQLAQVLINLVANARDAVDPASGRIEVSVTLANPGTTFSFGALPQRGHRWVAIRVTDNGAGMDADTLAHLFEPFFTKKRGGTGLGLPIAYKIVAAHEGLLFVESAEGKGSSFFLFLSEADAPARESDAAIEEES
ncbi:MAG TPA: PAS domain S-box protein, partial [Thermoanaerobaculia bacterium]